MANIGVLETSVTAVDIISTMVQEELRARAVLIPSITDLTSNIVPGTNIISVSRFTSLTAENKTQNTPLTAQVMTASQDEIALNKHKAVLINLERIAKTQSVLNLENEVMRRMASSIVDALEVEAYTVIRAATALQQVEYTTGTTLARADILNARRLLLDQNVPMTRGQVFMAINPKQEANILDIDNFIHADKYGSSEPIQNGELGRIYGFSVLVTTNVPDDETVFYHRTHAGYGIQEQIQFDGVFDADNISDKLVSYALAGFVTLDSGKRAVRLEDLVP